jgi:hypothetical protein
MGPLSASVGDSSLDVLIEALPDACVVIDETGILPFANQVWKDLPRQADAAAISQNPIGLNYLELYRFSLPSERLERAIVGFKSVLSGEVEQFVHEYMSHATAGLLVSHDSSTLEAAGRKRDYFSPGCYRRKDWTLEGEHGRGRFSIDG